MKKHMIRISVLAVALVSIITLALAFSTETSLAQGPGGNGRGGGQRGGGTAWNNGQGGYGAQNGNQNSTGGQGTMLRLHTMDMTANLPPAASIPLSDVAQSALAGGLQDEVNAYATYQAVIDQFGPIQPFSSIQSAEAQHMAALETMFERYGLVAPVLTPSIAVPQFASVADACAASAAAEIANFELYDQWLSQVSDYPDLVQVFTALRNASEFNHLPAFERCAG